MATAAPLTISHVVLHCFDLDAMVDFYTRILGLHVTDKGTLDGPMFKGARMVFLSSDPRDHHQLALAEGRTADRAGVLLNQVSYHFDSLARLQALRDALTAEGVADIVPANHGTHWSIYFEDPDGNRVEAFVETPWYVHQPAWKDLDLSLSEEELLKATEKQFGADPSFRPLSEWREEFAEECGVA